MATKRPSAEPLEGKYRALEQKHAALVQGLNSHRVRAEKLENELSRAKLTLESIVQQKQELSAAFLGAKEYTRKLEAKLTLGKQSKEISVTHQISELTEENLHLSRSFKQSQDETQKLQDHIAVLTKALELKAEDFKLKGDLRTQLLLDLGQSRQEIQRLREANIDYRDVIADLKHRLDESVGLIEGLRRTNDERDALEAQILHLTTQRDELRMVSAI